MQDNQYLRIISIGQVTESYEPQKSARLEQNEENFEKFQENFETFWSKSQWKIDFLQSVLQNISWSSALSPKVYHWKVITDF